MAYGTCSSKSQIIIIIAALGQIFIEVSLEIPEEEGNTGVEVEASCSHAALCHI